MSALEFFKAIIKGTEDLSLPAAKQLDSLVAQHGDGLIEAARENRADAFLEENLGKLDGADDARATAIKLLKSPRTIELLENLAEKQAFIDDFAKAHNKAKAGRTPFSQSDFNQLLEKHGVNRNSGVPGTRKIVDHMEHLRSQAHEAGMEEQLRRVDARTRPLFWNAYERADARSRNATTTAGRVAWRIAAGTERWLLNKYALGGGLVVLAIADGKTDHKSSKSLARNLNEAMSEVSEAIKEDWPEIWNLIKNLGPEAAQTMINVMQATPEMATAMLLETAKYHKINLSENQAKAFVQMSHGNLLGAGLTLSGHEIDPVEMIQVYKDAQNSGDPQAYVQKKLQEKFNLNDAQVAEYVAKGKEHKAQAEKLLHESNELIHDPKKAVASARSDFHDAAEKFDPTAEYGIVGGAMYSMALFMFRAGPQTAGMLASASKFLIGSWMDPLLGFFNIKPSFNAAAAGDALLARTRQKTPDEMRRDPNVLRHEPPSLAQPTTLFLQPEPSGP